MTYIMIYTDIEQYNVLNDTTSNTIQQNTITKRRIQPYIIYSLTERRTQPCKFIPNQYEKQNIQSYTNINNHTTTQRTLKQHSQQNKSTFTNVKQINSTDLAFLHVSRAMHALADDCRMMGTQSLTGSTFDHNGELSVDMAAATISVWCSSYFIWRSAYLEWMHLICSKALQMAKAT